jgi:hypothetical protein
MGWIICWEIQLSFNFHTLRTHSIRPYENFQLQCFCTVNEITTCSTLAHINNRRLFLNLQPCLPTILFIAMLLFLAFLLGYLFHAKRPLGERVHFITTSMEKTGNKPCVLHTFSSTKLGYWLQWRLQNRAKFQVMLFCKANLVNFRCEEKYVRVQDCSLVYTQAFIYSFAQEDQQHAPHAWEADSVPTTARPQPQQASTSWSESTQIFSLEVPNLGFQVTGISSTKGLTPETRHWRWEQFQTHDPVKWICTPAYCISYSTFNVRAQYTMCLYMNLHSIYLMVFIMNRILPVVIFSAYVLYALVVVTSSVLPV